MKSQKVFIIILILVITSQVCLGQKEAENQPAENWLKQYTSYQGQVLYQRYDLYSKNDIVKAKEKLDLLKMAQFDEWEGIYFGVMSEVDLAQLRWNSEFGFVDFSIYTCLPELRRLNYGKVLNTPETVQFITEPSKDSPMKPTSVRYVKIKWSERQYLVEENSLSAFAEKSVGIYVDNEDSSDENRFNWWNYWVRGDLEKPITGLPEFPLSYKRFFRFPIKTTILSVGKRTLEGETTNNITEYNSASYTIVIGAGKDKGVKEGMIFEIPDINETLTVTKVNQKTSIATISRMLDENKNDECFGENFNKLPCLKIKNGLKVGTQVGNHLL